MSIWCKTNKPSKKSVEKRAFYQDLLQKILYPEAGESPAYRTLGFAEVAGGSPALEVNGLKTCGMDFVSATW